MARKVTGSLRWTKKGYAAVVPVLVGEVDGKPVREKRWYPLETTSKALAKARMARIVADAERGKLPSVGDAKGQTENVLDAFERIVTRQGTDGLKGWKEKLSLLRRHSGEHIGHLTVVDVKPEHITETLGAARDTLSKQTIVHLRNALSTVFDDLWRDGVIEENPVKRARMPKKLRHDRRPRVSPTDELFGAFMACPDVAEDVHLMALTSRAFGGMRTSDLHAWDWGHVDTERLDPKIGGRVSAQVYRPKTDAESSPAELVQIIIPDELRAPLFAWWTRWLRPSDGPVFPVMNGKRAGERQGKRSHARELRRAFWRAGAHLGLPGFVEALGRVRVAERRLAELSDRGEGREAYREALKAWKLATDQAKALDAIQSDTPSTRCLDFHSLRRSYNTALAATNTNLQQAMALAGHARSETHMRYVQLAQRGPLEQPAAALPRFADYAGDDRKRELPILTETWRPHGDLNPGYRRERPMS